MAEDAFDQLVNGKEFDKRSEGSLVNGTWVMAEVFFDGTTRYVVKLNYGGDSTAKTYSSKEQAVERYEELVEEHDLD